MQGQVIVSRNEDTKGLFFSHIYLYYIQIKAFNTLQCIILHVASMYSIILHVFKNKNK